MRATIAASVIAAVLALPAGVTAGAMPGFDASLGSTLGIEGAPDDGGFSLSLAAMWPVEDRLSFGLMGFADDMGTRLGRLRDPNDGTDLGAIAEDHAWVYGAGWRADLEWGSLVTWLPYVSGAWGIYRVENDVRGATTAAVSSTGFSLGAGLRRAVSDRQALGASVRYHRLFNDRIGRYVSAAVDWSFR